MMMKKETPQQAMFYRELGANIRKLRRKRELSQEELANLVGLTRTSLTNIEKGRQHPPLHMFCDLVEQLKVDFSELLPRPATIKAPSDIEALAGKQVRGDKELEFIRTTITGEKPYGDTKTQDRGDGKRASGRKRH
jgi:transcriptional regulator with XRE-family HTH domain